MPKVLTEVAIEQYHREGYFFPIRILDDEGVAANRRRLEEFEIASGETGRRSAAQQNLISCSNGLMILMRNSKLLDAVEDLIGGDILCWNTIFWIKEAGSQSYVSWHQDLRYWGLDTNDLVSVWLALSPAPLESGCMHVLPGSHKGDLLPHNDEYQQDNLLTRGQEIAVKVDESKTVAMPLEPGEISLHNVRLAHASGPNRSSDRRIGISLHYMPTHTKQTVGEWDTAALVRGEDRFGHFTITPRPAKDFDPSAVLFHEKATDATRKILYKDAQEDRHTI